MQDDGQVVDGEAQLAGRHQGGVEVRVDAGAGHQTRRRGDDLRATTTAVY